MCHLLKIKNMPFSVTKRYYHSMSSIAISHNCAWLMVIGDDYGQADFVLLELSKWHNETKTSTQCMLMRCCFFNGYFIPCFAVPSLLTHTLTHEHKQVL